MKSDEQVAAADCTQLTELQRRHTHAFVRAYGVENVRPKHHYALHLPAQYRRDRFVLDTFVHERKHRVIKAAFTHLVTLQTFERDGLARVTQEQTAALKDPGCFFVQGLLGKTEDASEVLGTALGSREVLVGQAVQYRSRKLTCNDIILAHAQAAVILACCLADGEPVVLVQAHRHLGKYGFADKWERTGGCKAFSMRGKWAFAQLWFLALILAYFILFLAPKGRL